MNDLRNELITATLTGVLSFFLGQFALVKRIEVEAFFKDGKIIKKVRRNMWCYMKDVLGDFLHIILPHSKQFKKLCPTCKKFLDKKNESF